MIKKFMMLISVFFFSFTYGYADTPKVFPPELTYQGKPIDSLCFANMESDTGIIDLQHCGAAEEKYLLKGNNPQLIQQGFMGYNWQDPGISSEIQGATYYQFFNAGNKSYWIYSINNNGGSGTFMILYLVNRIDENTLGIKSITGGDRCNGGVTDTNEKNTTLTFGTNLTPYALLKLSNQPTDNIHAYDNLTDCAVCCIAKAVYTIEPTGNPKFQFINGIIDANVAQMPDQQLPDQGKYQKCFNQLFASHLKANNNALTQDKINRFSSEFEKTCLNPL